MLSAFLILLQFSFHLIVSTAIGNAGKSIAAKSRLQQSSGCGIADEGMDNVGIGPEGHLGFYPWAAALCSVTNEQANGDGTSPAFCFCTSSLISPRFLLTAGHCLFGHRPEELVVVIGAADYGDQREAKMIAVRRISIHSDYRFDVNGGPDDIGIVELVTPLASNERIRPICLDSGIHLTDGELAVVAGWGWTKNVGQGECAKPMSMLRPERTHLLHQGHLQIVLEPSKCALREPARAFVPDGREICTRGWDANPQHGDSGGPLMVRRDGHGGQYARWFQIGVASYGECHEENEEPERLPDIFASVQFYCKWIQNETYGEATC